MEYTNTKFQQVDVYSKNLPKNQFLNFVCDLGLRNVYWGRVSGYNENRGYVNIGAFWRMEAVY